MYKDKCGTGYENSTRAIFQGAGEYDIPIIEPTKITENNFIGFNEVLSSKQNKCGVHFFLDDYQFQRLWNTPDRYIESLQKFSCVLSPDFSLYTDYPTALQIYNHYRKHWIGAYLQLYGIEVIPTICWSDEKVLNGVLTASLWVVRLPYQVLERRTVRNQKNCFRKVTKK